MSNNTDKISILLKVTLEKANVKVSKVIPMVDAWSRPASENERKVTINNMFFIFFLFI